MEIWPGKWWKRRGASVSTDHEQSHDLPPHPHCSASVGGVCAGGTWACDRARTASDVRRARRHPRASAAASPPSEPSTKPRAVSVATGETSTTVVTDGGVDEASFEKAPRRYYCDCCGELVQKLRRGEASVRSQLAEQLGSASTLEMTTTSAATTAMTKAKDAVPEEKKSALGKLDSTDVDMEQGEVIECARLLPADSLRHVGTTTVCPTMNPTRLACFR